METKHVLNLDRYRESEDGEKTLKKYISNISGTLSDIEVATTTTNREIAFSCLGRPHFISVDTLVSIQNLIENTLSYYKEMGWDSDSVDALSNQIVDEAEAYDFWHKGYGAAILKREDPKRDKDGQTNTRGCKRTKIYIIRDSDSSALKVGRSYSPELRLQSLQTSTPHKLSLLAVFDGFESDETAIHKELKSAGLEISGEWFKDTEETVNIVRDFFSK